MKLAVYQSESGRAPFVDWFDALDGTQKRAVQRRLRAIEESDHFGDRKKLREGLHEPRFRRVIRIYFAEVGDEVVLLLGGSGKRNQRRAIDKAGLQLANFRRRKD